MRSWDEEAVFHEGDRFFDQLGRTMSQARQSIDLETYIFDRDRLGREVLGWLEDAARRGVRVRLLLDGFGCSTWNHADTEKLRESGIDTHFFHPLPWQCRSIWRIGLGKLNRRNHRKTCVIDGETAFLGGMNVSGRHSTKQAGAAAWRDTSVMVQGRDVRILSQAFEHSWSRARQFSRALGAVRINVTRRQRRAANADLTQRVLRARHRVWVTNPYFLPDFSLIRALRFAAWAGTDVRLLFPRKNDVWGMRRLSQAFYFVLLSARVRIFEYQPSVLHAKIVLIDDWVKVGSSNLNGRSLLRDLEADVVLSKAESVRSIENRFLDDLGHSKEVDATRWIRRPWFEKLMRLFRRWL